MFQRPKAVINSGSTRLRTSRRPHIHRMVIRSKSLRMARPSDASMPQNKPRFTTATHSSNPRMVSIQHMANHPPPRLNSQASSRLV